MRWSRCCDVFRLAWRHWRQLRGEAQALRLNDRLLTWREPCARVDALAAGFAAQGVMEGQGVALRAYNQPETLLPGWHCCSAGRGVLPLNPQLPEVLLQELLPALTRPASAGVTTAPPGNLPALTLPGGRRRLCRCWHGERLVSMTLTSGSTGLPKAARNMAPAPIWPAPLACQR